MGKLHQNEIICLYINYLSSKLFQILKNSANSRGGGGFSPEAAMGPSGLLPGASSKLQVSSFQLLILFIFSWALMF